MQHAVRRPVARAAGAAGDRVGGEGCPLVFELHEVAEAAKNPPTGATGAFTPRIEPVGDAESAAAEVGPAVGENEGFALSHPAGLGAVVGLFHVAGLRVEAVKADDGGGGPVNRGDAILDHLQKRVAVENGFAHIGRVAALRAADQRCFDAALDGAGAGVVLDERPARLGEPDDAVAGIALAAGVVGPLVDGETVGETIAVAGGGPMRARGPLDAGGNADFLVVVAVGGLAVVVELWPAIERGGRVEALEASVASVVVGASAGPGTRTARGRRLTRSL